MQLAFVLYKYFPFGGLQRDFMRIALACQISFYCIQIGIRFQSHMQLIVSPVHNTIVLECFWCFICFVKLSEYIVFQCFLLFLIEWF